MCVTRRPLIENALRILCVLPETETTFKDTNKPNKQFSLVGYP